MIGNSVHLVGNITREPELRYTPAGNAVVQFGLAVNRRYKRNGEDVEEVSFVDVTCWQSLAENVASSLKKGTRAVVIGRLQQDTWEDKNGGGKRSKLQVIADEVSPSLRWADCEVTKNPRDGEPWKGEPSGPKVTPPPSYDEEPF